MLPTTRIEGLAPTVPCIVLLDSSPDRNPLSHYQPPCWLSVASWWCSCTSQLDNQSGLQLVPPLVLKLVAVNGDVVPGTVQVTELDPDRPRCCEGLL